MGAQAAAFGETWGVRIAHIAAEPDAIIRMRITRPSSMRRCAWSPRLAAPPVRVLGYHLPNRGCGLARPETHLPRAQR